MCPQGGRDPVPLGVVDWQELTPGDPSNTACYRLGEGLRSTENVMRDLPDGPICSGEPARRTPSRRRIAGVRWPAKLLGSVGSARPADRARPSDPEQIGQWERLAFSSS
jgi:hypothetical protein